MGQLPGDASEISYDELLDVLERAAEHSGMTKTSASSWLSGVRKVLRAMGQAERGSSVPLDPGALERQELAVEGLDVSRKTRDNYLSGWKRARDIALDYQQARATDTEEQFWNRLERRGRRRASRRSESWGVSDESRSIPSPMLSSPMLSSPMQSNAMLSSSLPSDSSSLSSREVRFHTVYVPGVGELSVQLPEGLSSREASALVQFILEQVDGGGRDF